eukprot:Sspe_Gene.118689::Locus_112730_Transcript_1_2_Confidence_0.667_Length_517::g.118689::m.118689
MALAKVVLLLGCGVVGCGALYHVEERCVSVPHSHTVSISTFGDSVVVASAGRGGTRAVTYNEHMVVSDEKHFPGQGKVRVLEGGGVVGVWRTGRSLVVQAEGKTVVITHSLDPAHREFDVAVLNGGGFVVAGLEATAVVWMFDANGVVHRRVEVTLGR